MRRAALAAVPLLLLLCGCSTSVRLDEGAGNRAPAGLAMRVTAVRDAPEGVEVDLELRNDSSAAFLYTGSAPDQPVYHYGYLTERAWIQPVSLRCGTGLKTVTLAPGGRLSSTARVHVPNRLRRLRVGIAAAEDDFVVWAPMVDPATLAVGRTAERR